MGDNCPLKLRDMTCEFLTGGSVPDNYILNTRSNGSGIWTNTIRPSTINASFIAVSSIDAQIINVDTLYTTFHNTSTINTSSINVSKYISSASTFTTYLGANNISSNTINLNSAIINGNLTVNTISTNVISTNSLNANNITTNYLSTLNNITLINSNSNVKLTTRNNILYVGGYPMITEGNISSISSLYWEDTHGNSVMDGAIFNKNTGQGTGNYMVGVGTGSALNGALSVQYTAGNTDGNVLHLSSNNNQVVVSNSYISNSKTNSLNLQIIDNQSTNFSAAIMFEKTHNFQSTNINSELGYISFYGTAQNLSSCRAACIMSHQDGTAGISSIPGRIEFWTTDALVTDSYERMRITSNGNVGINTTTPKYTLDVNGSIYASTFLSTNNINMTNGIIGGVSTINGLRTINGNIDVNGSICASTFLSTNTINMTNGIINNLSNINSNNIVINENSNSNISIKTSDTSISLALYNKTNGGSIIMSNDYGTYGDLTMNGYFKLYEKGAITNQIVNFSSDPNTPSWIRSIGNFGIGTSTPQSKLDVNGSISVTNNINDNGANLSLFNNKSVFTTNTSYNGCYLELDNTGPYFNITGPSASPLYATIGSTLNTFYNDVLIQKSAPNSATVLEISNTSNLSTSAQLSLETPSIQYSMYVTCDNGSPSKSGLIPSTLQVYSYFNTDKNKNILTFYPNGDTCINGNLNVSGSAISCVSCSTIQNNSPNWPDFYGKYCFVTLGGSPSLTIVGSPSDGTIIVFRNNSTDSTNLTVNSNIIAINKTLSFVYTTTPGITAGWYSL